jgi:hypothetical protein
VHPAKHETDAIARWLRRRVARLRAETRRRMFPTCVEVLDADSVVRSPYQGCADAWVGDSRPPDRGLRVDLLCRLWGARTTAVVVIVRPGRHEVRTDEDAEWFGAAVQAAAILDATLAAFVVVSRWGWRDLISDSHREWRRLRIRSDRPAP